MDKFYEGFNSLDLVLQEEITKTLDVSSQEAASIVDELADTQVGISLQEAVSVLAKFNFDGGLISVSQVNL